MNLFPRRRQPKPIQLRVTVEVDNHPVGRVVIPAELLTAAVAGGNVRLVVPPVGAGAHPAMLVIRFEGVKR